MNKKARLLAGVLALSLAFSVYAFADETGDKEGDDKAAATTTAADADADKTADADKADADKEEDSDAPKKTAVELKEEKEADEARDVIVESMKKTLADTKSVEIAEKTTTNIKKATTVTDEVAVKDVSFILGEMMHYDDTTKHSINGVEYKSTKTIAITEETGFGLYKFDGRKWAFEDSTRDEFTAVEKEKLVDRFGFFFDNLDKYTKTGVDTVSGLNVSVYTASLTGDAATAVIKEFAQAKIDGFFASKYNVKKEAQKEAYDELLEKGYAAITEETAVKITVYAYADSAKGFPLKMQIDLGAACEAVVDTMLINSTEGSKAAKEEAAKSIDVNKYAIEITTKNYDRVKAEDIPAAALSAEKTFKAAKAAEAEEAAKNAPKEDAKADAKPAETEEKDADKDADTGLTEGGDDENSENEGSDK